jgi:hypothetical protein
MTPRKPGDDFRPYGGLSRRRRLLIVLLAVASAVAVVTTLLDPPGGVQRRRATVPDAPACSASLTTNCVGSKTEVLVAPPPTAASR